MELISHFIIYIRDFPAVACQSKMQVKFHLFNTDHVSVSFLNLVLFVVF